jgi:hypothetical protein
MEHLDARGGSVTENPANAGPEDPDRESAELDRALAHAIRQLIADFRDAAAPTA